MDTLAIDIEIFRKTPDVLRESQRKRFKPVEYIDDIIKMDEEWRKKDFDLNQLRKEKNATDKAIGKLKKEKQPDDPELIAKAGDLKKQIEAKEKEVADFAKQLAVKVNQIGSIVSPIAPISDTEDDNKVLRTYGPQTTDPEFLTHVDLVRMIDGVEYTNANVVAGARGYYLKGDLAMLWMGLQHLGMQFLIAKGYTPIIPPFFMTQTVMSECAQLEQFDEELYKVTGEGEDKYLIATAEQPLSCFHRGERLLPSQLPIRYVGYSSCFRKEAGSHGRDTLGIFRIHQFEKVEQFCIVNPEDSWNELERMITNSEEWNQKLGLSYRVVAIVSSALNNAAAAKYDLEGWYPGSQKYRELVSCSNCTDYQSRRLNIRLGQTGGDKKDRKFVHMLNSTLCAIQRTLCCLLETYQTKDGIKVPECLQPFVGKPIIPYKFTKKQVQEANAKMLKGMEPKAQPKPTSSTESH